MKPWIRFLASWPAGALLVALVSFTVTLLDVQRDFELLSNASVLVAVFATAATFLVAQRYRPRLVAGVTSLLALGALLALVIRALGYGGVSGLSADEWERAQAPRVEGAARRASHRFAELSRQARASARELARSTPIALATEGSDAQDYLSGAFRELARVSYPQAHPRGPSGATLYDAWRRPLAWSGENIPLYPALEQPHGVPPASSFILQQGVFTYLVAIEPLVSRLGFVSVEIPLIAQRRLHNRYLEDYDAISTWASKDADTRMIYFGDDSGELEAMFPSGSEPVWGGFGTDRRFYFPLRDEGGRLFGVSSIAAEAPDIARLEAALTYQIAAGLSLIAAAVACFVLLVMRGSHRLLQLLSLWGLRITLLSTGVPMGFGMGLDNPALYASSHLFGLAPSPIDLLLTSATLLVSALLAIGWLRSTDRVSRIRVPPFVTSAAALALIVGVNELVLDAWSNSRLPLGSVSSLPLDLPRLTLQVGLVFLFVAAGTTACFLIWLSRRARAPVLFGSAAVTFAIAYFAIVEPALRDHVLLAVPPFVAVACYALFQARYFPRGSMPGLYGRLSAASLLVLLVVLSFYPSIARFEDATIREFIETTVAPVVLEHGASRTEEMVATARAVDRMEEDGLLDALDREDLAYQLWIGTNLVASSLSSSIEIVDGQSEVVSQFAPSFPAFDARAERAPAPPQWIEETEQYGSEPNHPNVLLARRAIEGPDATPWEIRIRLAADWRNLPFITATNPYLYLFRTAGVDAPFRSPYRELSLFVLRPDGSTIFQSGDGSIQADDAILGAARRAPMWWDHSLTGQFHRAYLFSDGQLVFAVTYPRSSVLNHAAEFAAWGVLAAGLSLLVLAGALVVGAVGAGRGISPRALWAGIGTSFSGKLYVAFVLIALVPIASLAFLIRGIVIQQLQRDVEQEGMARAQVVERFVRDFLEFQREDVRERGPATVTDAVLDWVGSLASVDVDLYSSGELVATSKPELFGSGLLRARAVPSVYQDLVLDKLTHSIHREAVGSFEYLVVSVPIRIEPWQEPGILALPLASQKSEIDRRISSLNQTLLLAALGFSMAAAALAYSLARRIAGPIRTLTQATHRVADGDLDVSLQTTSKDEVGALFASFTQMTEDLKRQRTDLERTKKLEAWAEMARQVAHEVKNPLTPIQLSTEHMLRVFNDPSVDFEKVLEDCSATILQQVKALRQISMEFSTFASPEPLKPEITDIGALIRETVSPYVQSPPDGVSVSLRVGEGVPPLSVDARLLKRTVLNLVENALHALPRGGSVIVGVEPSGDETASHVDITVEDTGVGIDPDLKERIFEPYFSTRAAGTGLGLAIARKVVEDHGGTIELDSALGQGTKVRLRLPAAAQLRADLASATAAKPGS